MNLHPALVRLLTCTAAFALVVAAVVAVPATASAAVADPADASDAAAVPGRIVIAWDRLASASTQAEIRARHGLRTEETFDAIGVEVVSVPPRAVDHITAALNGERGVAYVELDLIVESATNDLDYGKLWGLHNTGQSGGTFDVDIDAPEAWAITRGSPEVIVAVVDTGIDISHPDLADNIWVNTGEIPGNGIDDDGNGYIDDVNGWDFHANDNTVYDSVTADRHGTHVAGTIAAVADNRIGIAGVAPKVKIMPVKVLGGTDGTGTSAAAAAAIRYAHANGATVINASWGGGGSTTLRNAIKTATGAVLVASAGNTNQDIDGADSDFPAGWADDRYAVPNVLSVASIDRNGNRSSFSNYGAASVDVGAPGTSIYSTLPAATYGSFSGTSMAAPHASGAAALLASLDASLTGAQLTASVKAGAQPLAALNGITTTGGLVNAHAALVSMSNARPGAPTGVTAKAGDASASVSWTAPGDDGGRTITGYTVTADPGGHTSSSATSSATVTGLSNGTAYTFTVTATNEVATGAPSNPSGAVTPTAPPPPPSGGGGDGGGGAAPAPAPSPEPAPAPKPAPAPAPEPEGRGPAPYDGSGSRSLEWACPGVTESGFTDVPTGSAHAPGVGCASAWSVFTGSSGGVFSPSSSLTRGQLASVLVRAIEQALGRPLPAGRDHFVDDETSVHRTAIDKLAELGIVSGLGGRTYAPGAPVTRGQFATMLARTYRHLAGELPRGVNSFVDDDGIVHEPAINGLAALGIVAGTGSGVYQPGTALSRGQSATLVARLLDALVEADAVARPTA